ncbi:hypothetical protein IKE84_00240 [Candidatus Saccharibacteria bacterium]|nr:hypothetical protein [Candidatus Saccharibacteria bacterium]
MDEDEGQGKSLGVYENMERSDIRPDFYDDEEYKQSNKSNAAKDTLKTAENAATNKAIEVGLNAATGGVGGTALKAAGGAGGVATGALGAAGGDAINLAKSAEGGMFQGGSSSGSNTSSGADGKAMLKKAMPVVALVLILVGLYLTVSFVGQWLFPFGFKAREVEDWNSTKVSTTTRTDALTNNTQLGDSGSSEAFSGVIFEDMGFTEEQVQSLNDAGIDYLADGGEKALRFHLADGSTPVVVSDKSVGAVDGESIAFDDGTIVDAGNLTEQDLEQRKQEIIDHLGIADNASAASVLGFTEAMKNFNIKEKYMTGTRSWRGDISGWFSEMTETVMARLGISRNNYKDFKLTGNNDTDEDNFVEIAKKLPSASAESSIGDVSFEERVKKVAGESEEANCGAISAANDIQGVITADQTARQVSAGSLWLEAIDKTMAGEGSEAPLSVSNNIIVRSGGADTEGIHHLFGSGELNQKDDNLLLSSAQANIGGNGSANIGAADEEIYRQCMYEGNTNNKEDGLMGGAIAKIGSMFKKILNWAKGIINIFSKGSGATAGVATAVLNPTIAKYNRMKTQTFFNGDNDTQVIGEAMVNSAERIMGEKAKTAGQTTGDNSSVIAFYREQQEVIAEQAEYDRRNKSPFDVTSEHTFLGSIAYSLIPLATSSQSLSITSTLGGIGSLFSSAVTNLLPTSSAVSETSFTFNRGDCVLANSLLAVSDGYCNQYYVSDLSMSGTKAVEVFDEVAFLREDKMGYAYGMGNCLRNGTFSPSIYQSTTYCKKNASDPDYGIDPLNTAENSAGHHWPAKAAHKEGEGTPNGCETDWAHETRYRNPITKTDPYEYYFFDYPIEWAYGRSTNFEYEGYQSGWHNRTSTGGTGIEKAVNDEAPGQCILDMKVNRTDMQPVINMNGALMTYMILSGQRGSDWGSTDDNNLKRLTEVDFTKGRLHPDKVGADNDNVLHPDQDSAQEGSDSIYEKLEWSGEDATASSRFMSRWIGGTSYTMRTAESAEAGTGDDNIYNVYSGKEDVFKDPTFEDEPYFWEEMRWYQAYTEILEWMEAIGKIRQTETSKAVAKYYDENPLDNSYEGIIARYSGMSKEHVIAVLDLINYSEFLAKYDPSDLGPLPTNTTDDYYYEETEVIAANEQAIKESEIVYDELRNRTVLV